MASCPERLNIITIIITLIFNIIINNNNIYLFSYKGYSEPIYNKNIIYLVYLFQYNVSK